MRRRPRKRLISNKVLLSVFISFIMVTSILGFIFGSGTQTEDELEYNGFKFRRVANYWELDTGNSKVKVNFFPTELTDVNVSDDVLTRIKSTKMIYISAPIQGENTDFIGLTIFELSDFLMDYGIYAQQAISDNNTGYALPLITCQNATLFVPVITFQNTNQTLASLIEDCIVLEAKFPQDFVKLKDKIVIKFLGIE